MAVCKRCGKKGLFLRLDGDGHCEACASKVAQERAQAELEKRRLANETLRGALKSIQDAQQLCDYIVGSGAFTESIQEKAIDDLANAMAAVNVTVKKIRSMDVDKLGPQAQAVAEDAQKIEAELLRVSKEELLPGYLRRHYGVVGTSFLNENGSSRQMILRTIANGEEPFAHGVSYAVKQYVYEGEPAFAVYANKTYQIGNISRTDIPDILKICDKIVFCQAKIYGGNDGKSYGAEITLTYKK